MKKKIKNFKNWVKDHDIDIFIASIGVTAFITYAILIVKANGNIIKIKVPPEVIDAFEEGTLTKFQTEDVEYIYTITQK